MKTPFKVANFQKYDPFHLLDNHAKHTHIIVAILGEQATKYMEKERKYTHVLSKTVLMFEMASKQHEIQSINEFVKLFFQPKGPKLQNTLC